MPCREPIFIFYDIMELFTFSSFTKIGTLGIIIPANIAKHSPNVINGIMEATHSKQLGSKAKNKWVPRKNTEDKRMYLALGLFLLIDMKMPRKGVNRHAAK